MNLPLLVGVLLGGLAVGYLIRHLWGAQQANSIEQKSKGRIEAAEQKAAGIVVEAQKKAADVLADMQREDRERKAEIISLEKRVLEREEGLDKRLAEAHKEETGLRQKLDKLSDDERELKAKREGIEKKLHEISGLSPEKAKEEMFRQIAESYREEVFVFSKKMIQER